MRPRNLSFAARGSLGLLMEMWMGNKLIPKRFMVPFVRRRCGYVKRLLRNPRYTHVPRRFADPGRPPGLQSCVTIAEMFTDGTRALLATLGKSGLSAPRARRNPAGSLFSRVPRPSSGLRLHPMLPRAVRRTQVGRDRQ